MIRLLIQVVTLVIRKKSVLNRIKANAIGLAAPPSHTTQHMSRPEVAVFIAEL